MLEDGDIPLVYSAKVDLYIYLIIIHKYSGFIIFIFSDFYSEFGSIDSSYPCWISHIDSNIALTELDLKKLKEEVMYSLIPLGTFILSTLYALCRLGVFSICNPLRCCPKVSGSTEQTRLTPKQLFRYKKALLAKKSEENEERAQPKTEPEPEPSKLEIPPTIHEIVEGIGSSGDQSPASDKLTLSRSRERLGRILEQSRDKRNLEFEELSTVLEHLEQIPYKQKPNRRRTDPLTDKTLRIKEA